MKTIAHLLRLIFVPEQFINVVANLIISEERTKNPSWLQPEGEFQSIRRAEIENSVRFQTNRLRRGIASGIVTTGLTIAVGTVAGTALHSLLGKPAMAGVYLIQASGAAVILGATLADAGSSIETWKKVSVSEQLNKLIFRGLYIAGTFLFVLSVAWDAA